MKSTETATAGGKASEELRSAILAEVERVAESAEFRQSEQSKRLLRYLVEHSIEGDPILLKERAIGVALFRLEDGYDTNEHPIVRVRMNEIRKRLAKYYQQNADAGAVRFEIPVGSYRVEFRTASTMASEAAVIDGPSRRVTRRGPLWKYLVAGLLPVVVGGLLWFAYSPDALSLFWRPALRSSFPVIICTGNPVLYTFTVPFREKMLGRPLDVFQSLTEVLKLEPSQVVSAKDIAPIVNQYVGLGSANAVARISAWLARRQKNSEMRFGNDLSFTDLRQTPAVLIGAFQNRWTLDFSRGFRFVFGSVNSRPVIQDTQTGKFWSLASNPHSDEVTEDYLIVSRVFHSESGQFLVMGAGITQYGTRAAGEVLTNPQLLGDALARVKPGWENRNLQLLFHVKVYGYTPGPPTLIALHQW